MTTASNFHHGSATGAGRRWVLVVAATGWMALTTVSVLLATGTWSIGPAPLPQQRTGPPPTAPVPKPSASPVPSPRSTPVVPSAPVPTPRIPAPRAAPGLIYAGSALALIPRQLSRH